MSNELNLDLLLESIEQKDTKKRIEGTANFLQIFQSSTFSARVLDGWPWSRIVDALCGALNDNNFRVAQGGLELLKHLNLRCGALLRPYARVLVNESAERFGDAKAVIRDAAQEFVMTIAESFSPKELSEMLKVCLNHKNWRVRDEFLRTVREILRIYGARAVGVKDLVTVCVKLLGDPNDAVRESAIITLEDAYKLSGETLIQELCRREVRPTQLNSILERLHALPVTVPTNSGSNSSSSGGSNVPPRTPSGAAPSTPFSNSSSSSNGSNSNPFGNTGTLGMTKGNNANGGDSSSNNNNNNSGNNGNNGNGNSNSNSNSNSQSGRPNTSSASSSDNSSNGGGSNGSGTSTNPPQPIRRRGSTLSNATDPPVSGATGGSPGSRLLAAVAVTKAAVAPIAVYSDRELEEHFHTLAELLRDYEPPWDDRMKGLKKIQGLIIGGCTTMDCFPALFNMVKDPLCKQVADLRSSVVREACTTVCCLVEHMRDDFDTIAGAFLPTLLQVVCNAVKVISDAADSCMKTIVRTCRLVRSFPRIIEATREKHQMLRQRCIEYILLTLEVHDVSFLDRHRDAVCRCIADRVQNEAGASARKSARLAYWAFERHFPDDAAALLSSLDATAQKHVMLERSTGGVRPTTSAVGSSISVSGGAASIGMRRTQSSTALMGSRPTGDRRPETAGAALVSGGGGGEPGRRAGGGIGAMVRSETVASGFRQGSNSSIGSNGSENRRSGRSDSMDVVMDTGGDFGEDGYDDSDDMNEFAAPPQQSSSLTSQRSLLQSSRPGSSNSSISSAMRNNLNLSGSANRRPNSVATNNSADGTRRAANNPSSSNLSGGNNRDDAYGYNYDDGTNSSDDSDNQSRNDTLAMTWPSPSKMIPLNSGGNHPSSSALSSNVGSYGGAPPSMPPLQLSTPHHMGTLQHTSSTPSLLSTGGLPNATVPQLSGSNNPIPPVQRAASTSTLALSRQQPSFAGQAEVDQPTPLRSSSSSSSSTTVGPNQQQQAPPPTSGTSRAPQRILRVNSSSNPGTVASTSTPSTQTPSGAGSTTSTRPAPPSSRDYLILLEDLGSKEWSKRLESLQSLQGLVEASRSFSNGAGDSSSSTTITGSPSHAQYSPGGTFSHGSSRSPLSSTGSGSPSSSSSGSSVREPSLPGFEKIMYAVLEHLNDPHFRVASCAFAVLQTFFTHQAPFVEPYLERMLPRVFLKLTDSHDGVRRLATECLEEVIVHFSAPVLVPVLGRLIDSQSGGSAPPRSRLGCLEFFLHVIPKSSRFFAVQPNFDFFFAKMARLAFDKNLDLRRSAGAVLAALYHVNAPFFFAQLTDLTSAHQVTLRKSLASFIPDIDAQSSRFIRQRAADFTGSGSVADSAPSYAAVQDRRGSTSGQGRPSAVLSQQGGSSVGMDGDYPNGTTMEVDSYGPTSGPAFQSVGGGSTMTMPMPMSGANMDNTPPSQPARTTARTPSSAQLNSGGAMDAVQPMKPAAPYSAAGYNGEYENSVPPLTRAPSMGSGFPDGRQVSSAEWISRIPSFLAQLSVHSERRDAILKLIRASREANDEVWTQYFGQVLLVVLDVLKDSVPENREATLFLLKELLKNQTLYVHEFVEIILARLLDSFRDSVREVWQAAEDALQQLISVIEPLKCVEVLTPIIMTEDGPPLQGSIRLLSKLVGRIAPSTLMAHLPAVLPGLFEAFKNPSADVRKAVVFCLVDIYMVLGDDFTPYLGELNTSQLKLVTIYIHRLTKSRTQQAMEPSSGSGFSAM